MTCIPRRRSLLASFSLTGILLAIILIHKNSENLQNETVLKSSDLLEVGTPSVSEASQNEKSFKESKIKLEKVLKVEEDVNLFRTYTVFNNINRESNLSSNNENSFATKETDKSLQEPFSDQTGEGLPVKESSNTILFSKVEPSDVKKSVKKSDNKDVNVSTMKNLDNKKEIESVQLFSKPVTDNLENSKEKEDEQSEQRNFDLMNTVNSGMDKGKYRNVTSEDESKHKENSEKLVLNHAKYNIQKPLTENINEETSPKIPLGKNEFPENSMKYELKNYEKTFENLNFNRFIFDLKNDKNLTTTEKAKAVTLSNSSISSINIVSKRNISNSSSSNSSGSSSSNSSSLNKINKSSSSNSSSTSSSINSSNISSSRNSKNEIRPLNFTVNLEKQNQNSFQNKSFSKKSNKVLKAPSYENVFKQLIVLNKIFIKKIFSKERKDVDFLPGERVPTDKVRRVLIVSTWRSGSTFLGDIFNSYPAAFYSFEPLHMKYRNKHLQKGEDIAEALSFIKDIFTCNITFHHEYMKYLREYQYVLVHNKFMWNSCYGNRAYCFDPNFMSQICQLTPLNVMKTVRLGLLPVDKLLSDKTLNLKVIHLVRDPRGSLHSRIKLPWCKSKICRDPKTVCDSLYTDLKLSDSFLKKYPERFQVIRYEDLSLNPRNVSEKILQFAGLHFHRGTENFLKEHTKLDDSNRNHKKIGAYTTFRDSQKTPFHWRESFSFPQTNYIQKMCKKTLDVLGFRIFRSPNDYTNQNISILMNS